MCSSINFYSFFDATWLNVEEKDMSYAERLKTQEDDTPEKTGYYDSAVTFSSLSSYFNGNFSLSSNFFICRMRTAKGNQPRPISNSECHS